MKILGNTPEGDLIIQVSKDEWNQLQSRIKSLNKSEEELITERWNEWPETEAGKLTKKFKRHTYLQAWYAKGGIDGSIKTLWRIANDEIKAPHFDELARQRLLKFLEEAGVEQ